MSELKTIKINDLIIEFDLADQDESFEFPHPIFQMAQEVDQLRQQLAELKAQPEAGEAVYVVVATSRAERHNTQFVEIETESGKSISVPWNDHSTALKRIGPLYDHPAPVVPEGYVLVPVEPTDAMIDAGLDACGFTAHGKRLRAIREAMKEEYQAMLSAAQEKAE